MAIGLSNTEKTTLIEATQRCFGSSVRIWLFGSRADDEKHSGDIDLYIETDESLDIFRAKLDFIANIRTTFGDQKIDLIVRNTSQAVKPIERQSMRSFV